MEREPSGACGLPTMCAFLCSKNHCDLLFVFLAQVIHSAEYQHLPESEKPSETPVILRNK